MCLWLAGFGSTDANPKRCSMCPQGTFNEGPLPRAEQQPQPNAPGAGRGPPDGAGGDGLGAGDDVGAGADAGEGGFGADGGMQNVRAARTKRRASGRSRQGVVSSGSRKSSVQVAAELGQQPMATSPADCSKGGCQPQHNEPLQDASPAYQPAGVHAAAVATASAATAATAASVSAVSPQQGVNEWGQLVNRGISPVFYEPTFNPCTPCGDACWTNQPGATSVDQCGEGCCCVELSNVLRRAQ